MIGEQAFNHSPGQTVLPSCLVCGALVGDPDVHRDWHARFGVEAANVEPAEAAEATPGDEAAVVDPTDALLGDPDVPSIVPIDV